MVKRKPRSGYLPQPRYGPGPWSVSLYHVRRDGPYAWPDPGTGQFRWLAAWTARLTMLAQSEAFNIQHEALRLAHKAMTFEQIQDTRLEEQLQKVRLPEGASDDDVHSLRPCLALGSPMRVYGIITDRVLHPLLWDPRHELLSPTDEGGAPTGGCGDCLHPADDAAAA